MKSIADIKTIARDYTGGPVVIAALKDAVEWIDLDRSTLEFWVNETLDGTSHPMNKPMTVERANKVIAYIKGEAVDKTLYHLAEYFRAVGYLQGLEEGRKENK